MFNNYLDVLEPDLFAKNPNLDYLYFGDNRIKLVGYDLLVPLKKLKKAIFQGNYCIRINAETAKDVERIQNFLNTRCTSLTEGEIKVIELQKQKPSTNLLVYILPITLIAALSIGFYYTKYHRLKVDNNRYGNESFAGFVPPDSQFVNERVAPALGKYETGSTNLATSHQIKF